MSGAIESWLDRHQHPVSRLLHAVGIPLLVWGLWLGGSQLLGWRWDLWWRPVGLIVASYSMQWVGHRIEGNDMGEVILIKKLLRRC
ncbi:MAG: Mpo1-like protein [Phycisphaerae bacterium]